MRPGYLSIETHNEHAGRVRVLLSEHLPAVAGTQSDGAHIRYVAHFNDVDAGLMHTHAFLKRRLLDPDAHLYRADLAQAIAAVESVALRHRTVYSDERIDQTLRGEIDRLVAGHRLWQHRQDLFFRAMGALGIAILLFNLLFLSLA